MANNDKIIEVSNIILILRSPQLLVNLLEINYISESELIESVKHLNNLPYRTLNPSVLSFLLDICKNDPDAVSVLFSHTCKDTFPIDFLFEYEHTNPMWNVMKRLNYDQFIDYINLMKIDINYWQVATLIYYDIDDRVKHWLIENFDSNGLLRCTISAYNVDSKTTAMYRHIIERIFSINIEHSKIDEYFAKSVGNAFYDSLDKYNIMLDYICSILEDKAYQITDKAYGKEIVIRCWDRYVRADLCTEKLEEKLRFIDRDVLHEAIAEILKSI